MTIKTHSTIVRMGGQFLLTNNKLSNKYKTMK